MNREKYCSTPQYHKWRNELYQQKFILRNLDKSNIPAIISCEEHIKELKKLMKI